MHGLKGRVNVVRPIWNVEDEAGAEEDDDTGSGMRSTLRMLDPMKPSPAEVDEHNKTHLPYRLVQVLREGPREGDGASEAK